MPFMSVDMVDGATCSLPRPYQDSSTCKWDVPVASQRNTMGNEKQNINERGSFAIMTKSVKAGPELLVISELRNVFVSAPW